MSTERWCEPGSRRDSRRELDDDEECLDDDDDEECFDDEEDEE